MTDGAQQISIPARDGLPLAATLFGSGGNAPAIVVSSATAVPRRFYGHFARFFVARGYIVVIYDYRGIGGSRPTSLRGFHAAMRDWGLLDMAGVVDWAHGELHPSRLALVGHSVGGQVAGLIDNRHLVDAMVTVSSQSGHWRLQGGNQRWPVAAHMHLTLPLLAHLLGYVPWSQLTGGEDLPKGVASNGLVGAGTVDTCLETTPAPPPLQAICSPGAGLLNCRRRLGYCGFGRRHDGGLPSPHPSACWPR